MPGFRTTTRSEQDMDVLVRGSVTTQEIAYVQHAVAERLRPGLAADHLKVKVAEYHGRDRTALCVAQVNVEHAGRLVRAQEAAATGAEATDRAAEALPSRVRRLDRHLRAARTGPPSFTGERWDRRRARGFPFAVKAGSRARGLVRHKAYALAVQDPGTAALTLALRDYDFHLFVEDASGQDTVVYRAGHTGYRLAAPCPAAVAEPSSGIPVIVDDTPMPVLTLPEAVRALDGGGVPFLAFVGVGTGRGAVLYRRFDGHLGLVTPLW